MNLEMKGLWALWCSKAQLVEHFILQTRKPSPERGHVRGVTVAEWDCGSSFPGAEALGAVFTCVQAAASGGAGGAGRTPYLGCYGCLLFYFRGCLVGLVKSLLSDRSKLVKWGLPKGNVPTWPLGRGASPNYVIPNFRSVAKMFIFFLKSLISCFMRLTSNTNNESRSCPISLCPCSPALMKTGNP